MLSICSCQSPGAEMAMASEPASSNVVERSSNTSMDDPALMAGSDFFNYFTTLYKLEQFDVMISLTSKESIAQHGVPRLKKFYRDEFNLGEQGDYRLISKVQTSEEPAQYNLKYKTMTNNQVEKIVTIPVIRENDTIKIVLPSKLTNFFYNFAKK